MYQKIPVWSSYFESFPLWCSLFYHNFECLVSLTIFECLNQISSVLCVNSCTTCSRSSLLAMCSIFNLLMDSMSSAMKFLSSLLFLTIVHFLVCMCSSKIIMLTISRAWSDNSLHLGWIVWLSNSAEVSQRNMRSITRFKLFWLSTYLVGTWLVDLNI